MIQILGSYGNRSKSKYTTSFLIREDIAIDAGNLSNSLGDDVSKLEHIFITHSHFDHILDIPFVIDTGFENRKQSLKIYALKETLESLKGLFNDQIWPDFSKIKLLNNEPAIQFIEIEEYEKFIFDDLEIEAIPANHTVATVGYKITKKDQSVIISSDTYLNDELVDIVNSCQNLKLLIIEVSFPNRLESLAKVSKHLTPNLVNQLVKKFNKNIKLAFYHFKVEYKQDIVEELYKLKLVSNFQQILEDGMKIKIFNSRFNTINKNRLIQELTKFSKIGIELSKQTNIEYLLEDILSVAREFTNADGGSVYLKKDDKLYFKIIQNDTLNISMGGRNSKIEWEPLYIHHNGEENNHMVAVLCALTQKIFNIPDVYLNKKFDFSGTREFDKNTGFRSKSMLVIPLINHEKETIGVLQLINKKYGNTIIPFSKTDEEISLSLASQAAVFITKNKLIESLKQFIESFINLIATAIDEKSKYTGKHIQKVSILAEIMTKEINKDKEYFKDKKYNKNMINQMKIASLLHDIGKITTDPRIMDKSTKLETTLDKIDIIAERFEIIKRDFLLQGISDFEELEQDFIFLKNLNLGAEFVSDDKILKIEEIANKYMYMFGNKKVSILRDDEIEMLKIRKGTLSDKEREHINRHAIMTLDMLSKLPFPKEYSEVTHIAANHHEKLNGKGYPRGLTQSELTLEDKILAICDIFEALTASDRPYKTPKKLSEVFKIMEFMVKGKEIDEILFEFFIKKEIWKQYIKYLLPEQIDI